MTGTPPSPDSGPARAATTGAPRWVKIFGIIAVVIVLLLIIVLLAGGGDHGPGRHTGSGPGGHTAPSSSATNHGAQSP